MIDTNPMVVDWTGIVATNSPGVIVGYAVSEASVALPVPKSRGKKVGR